MKISFNKGICLSLSVSNIFQSIPPLFWRGFLYAPPAIQPREPGARDQNPYPSGKPKDFLIETGTHKTKEIHEEVNIHCKLKTEASSKEILDEIIQKTKEKVLSETKGKYEPTAAPLSFVVVLWHTSVAMLREQMDFFDRPNNTVIPEISELYHKQGFYTYIKLRNKMKFINVYDLKELP